MKISQLTKLMPKDDEIIIDDENLPIDRMNIYAGTVRGVKRDNPINKMHITSICAYEDRISVLVANGESGSKAKGA